MWDTSTETTETSKEKKNENSFSLSKDSHGKITETIGTGNNAKDSIVYLTIKWGFISGVIITFFVIMNTWLFRSDEKVPDFIGDVVSTWGIIVPVITLALGYAFGKSEK